MSLILGQLIYTSFAKVGFQVTTSANVPPDVRQAFIEQIVYQNWDSYNPPSSDYRAAYLYQIASDRTLFGWLYNDGADDLGRRHVPYFICYYWAETPQPVQLNAIFNCLLVGPIRLIDRHRPPALLDSIFMPEHKHYQAERSGVSIFSQIQEQARLSAQQGKLFRLFVSEDETGQSLKFETAIKRPRLLPEPLSALAHSRLQHGSMVSSGSQTALATPATSTLPNVAQEQLSVEAYQKILLSKMQNRVSQPSRLLPLQSRAGRIAASIVLLMALVFGVSYVLRNLLAAKVGQLTASSPSNRFLSNIAVPEAPIAAKTLLDTAPIWSVIWGADDRTVIGGGANQKIKIWNVETGKVLATLSGHNDTVRSLALAPDGRTLISGSADGTIRLWDLQTNQVLKTLNQEGSVWSVAVSQDGRILASAGEDGILKLWYLPTGEPLYSIAAYQDLFVSAIAAHQGLIFSVAISPDGKTIATASLDRTIKLWNAQTGALIRTLVGHTNAVRAVTFSPDGQTLASASWDKTLKLWNWQTGELIRTFDGHRDRVVAVAFSADGQMLISGSVDRTIKFWAAQDGKLLRSLSDHSDWVLSLAVNPKRYSGDALVRNGEIADDTRLVSSSKDQTIRIWQSR